LCDEAKAKCLSAKATYEQADARYNKSEADVDVAVANVAVAEATHDQQRDWLAYRYITAPYDGVVTLRNVHEGHFLQPSNSGSTSKAAEPLFVMMRTEIMRCYVDVPELDALLIKVGDKAVIHFQAMPGVETLGEVTRFTTALNEKSRCLGVELHLKNPDNKLLPGMYANVTILAKQRNAWVLPAGAVMSDILKNGDRDYCFVVENGKVHKTFVQVGIRCGEGLQILRKQQAGHENWEDITGQEAVVVTNITALQDGQAVKSRTADPH
jgi:HlyD family secretion protein